MSKGRLAFVASMITLLGGGLCTLSCHPAAVKNRSETSMLKAALDVRKKDGVWADLRIVNAGSGPAQLHNPGNPQPTEKWEHSVEAYRTAVLLSFHFLEMNLYAADGAPVPRKDVATLADHAVDLPLELQPGAAFTLSIPISEFYDLGKAGPYRLAVEYGDPGSKVSAEARFDAP